MYALVRLFYGTVGFNILYVCMVLNGATLRRAAAEFFSICLRCGLHTVRYLFRTFLQRTTGAFLSLPANSPCSSHVVTPAATRTAAPC